MFKKIIYTLFLTALMVNTTYAEEVNTIDIPVKVEVETVDHKVYANNPDTINIEMFYQDNTLQWVYEDITLLEEENFETIIKDLSKGTSSDWHIRYDFRVKDDDLKYYAVPSQIIRLDSGKEPFDSEVKYEITLLKTSIELDLKFGNVKNTYDHMCWYGEDESEEDEDYYLYSINFTDLADAKFQLLDEDGKLVQEQTTNADGKLIFDEVPYGMYKIKQINAPKGLKINEAEMNINVDIEQYTEGCEYIVEWFNSEEPEVPVEETPEVPTEETPEVPVEETPEVPTEETPEVPTEETPEVPTKETPKGPVDETPELPRTGMFDVRSIGGTLILSGLLIFMKKRK